MTEIRYVIDLTNDPQPKRPAVGHPGEGVADGEVRVAEQRLFSQNLARAVKPAAGDQQIAQVPRVSPEHSGVHRITDSGDIDIDPTQSHDARRLGLGGQDPHHIRVRKTVITRDDHLHVACGGLTVVDLLEAARHADGYRHRRRAQQDGKHCEAAAQRAGKRLADAEHDGLRKPKPVGSQAQEASAGAPRRGGRGQHHDWLQKPGSYGRQRGGKAGEDQGTRQGKQPHSDGKAGFVRKAKCVRAVRQQRLGGDRAHWNADQAGEQRGRLDLQHQHSHHVTRRKADRLHDPDLAIRGNDNSSHQVGHDGGGGREREDAERDQHAGEDLVGDVEDACDQQEVGRPGDASRRQASSELSHVAGQLCRAGVGREAVVHLVEGRVRRRRGEGGDRRTRDPGMLAAEVGAPFVDIDELCRHGQDGPLRHTDHLQPVADRNVVELGEGSRERDLVIRGGPVPRRDPQHLDIARGVVAAERVERELPASMLKLDRCRWVRSPEGRRADERRRRGECLPRGRTVVINLEMRALLRRERCPIRVARLRHQGQGHHSGAHGQKHREENHSRLEPPPAQIGPCLDEDRVHRAVSSPRTRITSAGLRSAVSSRASSTTRPSMMLITRAA